MLKYVGNLSEINYTYYGYMNNSTPFAGVFAGGNDWKISTTNQGAPGDTSFVFHDSTGFSALPAGGYGVAENTIINSSTTHFITQRAYFWSSKSSNNSTNYAVRFGLFFSGNKVRNEGACQDSMKSKKENTASVRCIRNSN